jgi:hypothetical protein
MSIKPTFPQAKSERQLFFPPAFTTFSFNIPGVFSFQNNVFVKNRPTRMPTPFRKSNFTKVKLLTTEFIVKKRKRKIGSQDR